MNPAALFACGITVLVLMSAQAAPTGDPETAAADEEPRDIIQINLEAGLLGNQNCPDNFECKIECAFGYEKGEDGCPVCSCIPDDQETVFEGDIVVDRREKNRILYGDGGNKGSVIGKHWPGRVVPYVISSSIGPQGIQAINAAIADFHRLSCVRLQPRTNNERAYIRFYKGRGCSSPVGYRAGRVNQVSLASGCWDKGTVIHEMMHSLGFYHEQSRPDRDNYVTINLQNVASSMRYNFNKHTDINSLGTPYDYASVMHYGRTAFGSGRTTIRTKNGQTIGQRRGLSETDIKQLNLLYKCGGAPPPEPPKEPTCVDKDKNCPYWESYCSRSEYINYMNKFCRKTCSKCG